MVAVFGGAGSSNKQESGRLSLELMGRTVTLVYSEDFRLLCAG